MTFQTQILLDFDSNEEEAMKIESEKRVGAYYFNFDEQNTNASKVRTVRINAMVLLDENLDIRAIMIDDIHPKSEYDKNALFYDLEVMNDKDIIVGKDIAGSVIIDLGCNLGTIEKIIWEEVFLANLDFDYENKLYGMEIIVNQKRK